MSAKRDFYEEQIQLLQALDADRLIDEHYTADAQLISPDGFVQGTGPLKEFFRGHLKVQGTINVLSTDSFVETDDSVLFEATIRTNAGTFKVYDGWVFRDGKISHHFTGVYP